MPETAPSGLHSGFQSGMGVLTMPASRKRCWYSEGQDSTKTRLTPSPSSQALSPVASSTRISFRKPVSRMGLTPGMNQAPTVSVQRTRPCESVARSPVERQTGSDLTPAGCSSKRFTS